MKTFHTTIWAPETRMLLVQENLRDLSSTLVPVMTKECTRPLTKVQHRCNRKLRRRRRGYLVVRRNRCNRGIDSRAAYPGSIKRLAMWNPADLYGIYMIYLRCTLICRISIVDVNELRRRWVDM